MGCDDDPIQYKYCIQLRRDGSIASKQASAFPPSRRLSFCRGYNHSPTFVILLHIPALRFSKLDNHTPAIMLRTLAVVLLLVCGLWSSNAFAPAARTTECSKRAGMGALTPLRASSLDDTTITTLRQSAARAVATASLAAAAFLLAPALAHADGQTTDFKFPPIDFSDKQRCVLKSSSMGQANAARDSLFDLRQCQLSGVKASGYDLSGAGTY